ncbi:MAG: peroxiredoxin [Xanthomonadales bacterium]|nr:peroxiredoxin [Xanthomonadales bacterium]
MRQLIMLVFVFAVATFGGGARAALDQGDPAPDFTATAYLAGEAFQYHLSDALKNGTVVLYFFPAPHTSGCNVEARLFSEAVDEFKAAGATVVGVTAGKLDELADFSREAEHCSGKFPVVADADGKITEAYDAKWLLRPGWSNRTSYVISKDGGITRVHSELDPRHHVKEMLEGVKALETSAPAKADQRHPR